MAGTTRNLLIVEGQGDIHFLDHILRSRGFSRSVQAGSGRFIVARPESPESTAVRIIGADGFKGIPEALKREFRADDLAGLAIVADMDLLEDNRWESLRGTLAGYGFDSLTKVLPKEGLVARQEQNPALGVWMMPDNENAGMLETFACRLVAGEDPAWLHATAAVASLPEGAGRFSRERHLEKALIHTWLAWQEEPGCQLGTAVAKKYLRTDHDDVGRFCSWIERWLAASEGAGFRVGRDGAF